MTAGAARPIELMVRTRGATKAVSPTLYGLFLEDINFACDGGLNANLVNNYSFEGAYLENGTRRYIPLDLVPPEHRERLANTPPELLGMPSTTPAGRLVDRTRHWTIRAGRLSASDERPVAVGAWFGRIESDGQASLDNLGYPGDRPSMPFTPDAPMLFSALVRSDQFRGELEVSLLDAGGEVIVTEVLQAAETGWQSVQARLTAAAAGLGSLRIGLRGTGIVDLDQVTLVRADHWGEGDPRWSQGVLRRDLVEALGALSPRFLRFPGGCIIEGCGDGSHYQWKHTVGPLVTRTADYNLWGQSRADGDYSQSNQVGFYEYFLLCEDLGIEPMPVVWAGVSCQTRMDEHLAIDSPEFAAVIQDAVDLIDWATADPASNPWAALRAEAGHPEPFDLKVMGVGNENFGPAYLERFAAIRAAILERRPDMRLIVTGGVIHAGESIDPAWNVWGDDESILVDEHFYNSPAWFFDSNDRYDSYPRGGAHVYLGEYAAHTPYPSPDTHPMIPRHLADPEPNTWLSALAEAAFLTGVERNADIVEYSCYAPLLNLVENSQWQHNLIDFSPTHVMPTANYLVQQAFATHIGTKIVAVEGDTPPTVFASATASDGTVYVKVVNIAPHSAKVSLRVQDAADGHAAAVYLSCELDAVNRLTFEGSANIAIAPEYIPVAVQDGVADLELEPGSVFVLAIPRAIAG